MSNFCWNLNTLAKELCQWIPPLWYKSDFDDGERRLGWYAACVVYDGCKDAGWNNFDGDIAVIKKEMLGDGFARYDVVARGIGYGHLSIDNTIPDEEHIETLAQWLGNTIHCYAVLPKYFQDRAKVETSQE